MGQAMIEIELPFPPSVNHYYRRLGTRTLISREGRRYRDTVCALLAATGVRPMEGPLRVQVWVYPPDRRRRDCDNPLKALFDALQHGGAFRDDSQVKKLELSMGDPVPGGRTIVRIWRLEC